MALSSLILTAKVLSLLLVFYLELRVDLISNFQLFAASPRCVAAPLLLPRSRSLVLCYSSFDYTLIFPNKQPHHTVVKYSETHCFPILHFII